MPKGAEAEEPVAFVPVDGITELPELEYPPELIPGTAGAEAGVVIAVGEVVEVAPGTAVFAIAVTPAGLSGVVAPGTAPAAKGFPLTELDEEGVMPDWGRKPFTPVPAPGAFGVPPTEMFEPEGLAPGTAKLYKGFVIAAPMLCL
jgi:hypothetical protein